MALARGHCARRRCTRHGRWASRACAAERIPPAPAYRPGGVVEGAAWRPRDACVARWGQEAAPDQGVVFLLSTCSPRPHRFPGGAHPARACSSVARALHLPWVSSNGFRRSGGQGEFAAMRISNRGWRRALKAACAMAAFRITMSARWPSTHLGRRRRWCTYHPTYVTWGAGAAATMRRDRAASGTTTERLGVRS